MALKDHMIGMVREGKIKAKGRRKASAAMSKVQPKAKGGY